MGIEEFKRDGVPVLFQYNIRILLFKLIYVSSGTNYRMYALRTPKSLRGRRTNASSIILILIIAIILIAVVIADIISESSATCMRMSHLGFSLGLHCIAGIAIQSCPDWFAPLTYKRWRDRHAAVLIRFRAC